MTQNIINQMLLGYFLLMVLINELLNTSFGLDHAVGRRRVFFEHLRCANRAGHQIAAAIAAGVVSFCCAIFAVGALECAD